MLVRTTKRGAAMRVMPRDRQRRPDGRPLIDLRPGERPSERRPLVTGTHQPVMVEEVLHFLSPRPGGVYVDATLGAGGHAEAVLDSVGGRCTLIGIDRDPFALNLAAHNLAPWGGAVRLVQAPFDEIEWIVAGQGVDQVDGVLLDLGMSSMQIDDPERGFSFHRDGPLDMRMDPGSRLSAAEVVNSYDLDRLERVIRTYGEDRYARRIARAIGEARSRGPIRTTAHLAGIVADAYPAPARKAGHPARRTFQALRIEVNDELGRLERVLRSSIGLLSPGGRIVVLSYHSLEDKMAKRLFASSSDPDAPLPGLGTSGEGVLQVLTRGAVLPSEAEVQRNPRASSARLRAAARRPMGGGR
ncbi:MAG TPA: 16S rRNA (cytosine(1402)-N(4))-methyltransferase RsmH [Actinomycetota bacterium]|nr:16S rRNA (cytosine(1402)-N(4))-methyltransferase RsmH [Actinomycetota bacterium]